MNEPLVHRSRSNSKAHSSSATPEEEIDSLISTLKETNGETFGALQAALHESLVLQRLRHILIDRSSEKQAKDAFRRAAGFQTLLSFLSILSDHYDTTTISQSDTRLPFFSFYVMLSPFSALGFGVMLATRNISPRGSTVMAGKRSTIP